MAEELLIYANQPTESRLALRIVLDDKGRVSFTPGDEHADEAMALFAGGVGSRRERRLVTPDEGEAYLRAVADMLDGATAWTAVPQAAAAAGKRSRKRKA